MTYDNVSSDDDTTGNAMQASPAFFHMVWAKGELQRLVGRAERKQAMVKQALATGYVKSYIRNRAQLKQYVNDAVAFSARYQKDAFPLTLLTRLGRLVMYVDAMYGIRRDLPVPAAVLPSVLVPVAAATDSIVHTNVDRFRAGDAAAFAPPSTVTTLPPQLAATPSSSVVVDNSTATAVSAMVSSPPFLRRSVVQAAKPRRKRARPRDDAGRVDDQEDQDDQVWLLERLEPAVATPTLGTPTWHFQDLPFVSDDELLDDLQEFPLFHSDFEYASLTPRA